MGRQSWNYVSPWLRAQCRVCRRRTDIRRTTGCCFVCSKPVEIRAIVAAGLPSGTAASLRNVLKKAIRMKAREVTDWLRFVHPVVMENVKVVRVGESLRFALIDKKARWIRNNGWAKR